MQHQRLAQDCGAGHRSVDDQTRAQARATHLEGERLVALELDEQHRQLVVGCHGLRLVVEPPAGQALAQIREGLALHAQLRSQDVVTHLWRAQGLRLEVSD